MDSHSPYSFLTKGSQVEVSSDEDGLTGAWFVATVIHPPPSVSTSKKNKPPNHHTRNNLVYVEYHNLLSEDGSSRRLREYANVSYIRPSPHPDTNAPAPNFQLNDLVDAFYRDAWWTGTISAVVDDSNFIVAFQNPPDQIQFHSSDLRVHRKWVAGRWIQPEKQRTAGLMFTAGKKVEVSFEREDLRDVWFPATVLKDSGNNCFLVEYQQPGIGDEAALHKVTVDYLHIRPSPPHLRDKNFVLLEKVDAYFDFGWWSGVITKELADNRYNVFFKHAKKEREFIYSRVRPHMEWKGGKWFNTSQGDVDGRTIGSLMDRQIEQTTPSIGKQSTVATSIMKRTKQTTLDSNDKNSLPSKRLNNEILSDDPSLSKMAPCKKSNNPPVGQSEGFDSEASVINDQAFGKTENLSHGKKVYSGSGLTFQLLQRSKRGKGTELKSPTMDSSRKKVRLADEPRSLKALGKGAKGDPVQNGTQENVEREHVSKDLVLPVVIGLKCNVMTISGGKKLQQLSSERMPNVAEGETKQSSISLAPLTVVNEEGKEGDADTVAPKRKRGRPPKLQAISPKTPVAVNHQEGGVGSSAVSVVEVTQRKEVGSPTSSGTKALEENQAPVKEQLGFDVEQDAIKQNMSTVMEILSTSKDKLRNENVGQDRNSQRGKKKYSSIKGKRGKRRTISINTESPAEDCQGASKEKADGCVEKASAKNTEASVGKSLDMMSDDQPLSRWFGGMQSPMAEGMLEQSSKASERRLEIVTCENAIILPFVRSTPLWQTIESMEAFRMIPQKPHFRPLLEGVKESAREGLAIGSMVTFSSVVEKTCGLRFDDGRSGIEDCLETLVELESHGFEVEVIRDRLTGLLLIKDKEEELEERWKGVGEKIEELKLEEKRMDEEIGEIDREIKELEERRRHLLLKKERRDSEVGVMKAAMEQEMRQVGVEFDGLAAAPL
ncbi:DUF724 domain-containing protein 3-like isoform X1 [Cynara cardunculus var. scolymus]|uniref:DUF724 domain-containing protein 3-like isoform X1 n=1 Tax=Cynara cardunculus var. scolymus TaxID=59895 RepID=UPI000D62573C|nr:DUF724 domain-containing protein 3-like isoform X1 [Cynara cardunculus var. scolymus]